MSGADPAQRSLWYTGVFENARAQVRFSAAAGQAHAAARPTVARWCTCWHVLSHAAGSAVLQNAAEVCALMQLVLDQAA